MFSSLLEKTKSFNRQMGVLSPAARQVMEEKRELLSASGKKVVTTVVSCCALCFHRCFACSVHAHARQESSLLSCPSPSPAKWLSLWFGSGCSAQTTATSRPNASASAPPVRQLLLLLPVRRLHRRRPLPFPLPARLPLLVFRRRLRCLSLRSVCLTPPQVSVLLLEIPFARIMSFAACVLNADEDFLMSVPDADAMVNHLPCTRSVLSFRCFCLGHGARAGREQAHRSAGGDCKN